MRMKLCFSTLACPKWTLEETIEAAVSYGVQGFDPRGIGPEIDITRLPAFTTGIEATRDLLRKHNLQVPCLNTSVTLVTPAQERWHMMLDECRRYATVARQLGSGYIRIFGGAVPKDMTREEACNLGRRHLQQVIKVCAGDGCLPLLETHDDWATSGQVMMLLNGFTPEEAGCLWDVEHPYRRGEAPQTTAQALRPYIRHTHFKDSLYKDGKSIPRLLGEGDLPLKDIIAALRGIGYDQWVCLEAEKRWHPDTTPDPQVSIPQFVAYMKKAWPAAA